MSSGGKRYRNRTMNMDILLRGWDTGPKGLSVYRGLEEPRTPEIPVMTGINRKKKDLMIVFQAGSGERSETGKGEGLANTKNFRITFSLQSKMIGNLRKGQSYPCTSKSWVPS